MTVWIEPNAALAWRVLDHIDAHPEQWDQSKWIGKARCGTVACFAGWACLLSGEKPDFMDGYSTTSHLRGGRRYVSGRAEQLLRVNRDFYDEVSHRLVDLFDGEHSREDLGIYVERMFGPRPATSEGAN